MSDYAHPESLVSTQWLANHLDDPMVRIIEVVWGSEGPAGLAAYEEGHISGAVAWDYQQDYFSPNHGDIADKGRVEENLSRAGAQADTTIVLYGGMENMNAAYEFWLLKIYGHQDVRLLDGGRKKWLGENRPLTRDVPVFSLTEYRAREPLWNLRATRDDILRSIGRDSVQVVDARTADMYSGKQAAGTQRAGHIPGALNLPARFEPTPDGLGVTVRLPTTQPDGTFKTAIELVSLMDSLGIAADKEIITYCMLGGASTHAWFVLTQLLGYPNVREYDRSWAEWGNIEVLPVAA